MYASASRKKQSLLILRNVFLTRPTEPSLKTNFAATRKVHPSIRWTNNQISIKMLLNYKLQARKLYILGAELPA